MKSNKEKIYDFLKLYASAHEDGGVTTQYLAEALGILRTNASSSLNKLVAEGQVVKTTGRPVLYRIKSQAEIKEDQCFENIIGANGSLRHQVQLAKAAIIYPEKSLNTLIIGEQGTGKSYLAMIMHCYAIAAGILPPDAPYIIIDCKDYANNESEFLEKIFGINGEGGIYSESKKSVLHIDNAHILSAGIRGQFCSTIEQYQQSNGESSKKITPILIVASNTSNKTACDDFAKVLPIMIEIPSLSERPTDERLALIQNLFNVEAARAKKTIIINTELLRCLLLYDCALNIQQLKGDIKRGCAMAYLREHDSKENSLNLYLYDFEPYIRKGFINYHDHREEIEHIIPSDYSYAFSGSTMKMSALDREKIKSSSFYDLIDHKANDLLERGLSKKDVNLLLTTEFKNIFHQYLKDISKQVINKEQLIKLVDERTIPLVETFLNEVRKKTNRDFPPSVFYGLCLHVDSIVKGNTNRQLLSDSQILEFSEHYKDIYLLALQFVAKIEEVFSITLPSEEAIFITMLLCFKESPADDTKRPVVLFALLGSNVAASLSGMVNQLIQSSNTFFFEIPFERHPSETYQALSSYIKKIDRGKGIIALYDMRFIKDFFESIALETGIRIRSMEFPITLASIELARRATSADDVDILYQNVIQNFQNFTKSLKQIIVTLCTTGEGSAQELKKYIEKYGEVQEMEIVSLSTVDQGQLHDQIQALQTNAIIHCIIGVNDPKLFGIPFISISDVLGADPAALPQILRLKIHEKNRIDFDEVFDYLGEQLEHVDIKKMQRTLPPVIEQINRDILYMSIDTEIGLLIHIACSINHILAKDPIPKNIHKEQILKDHSKCYKSLLRIIKPLEHTFGIIFSDDELANIIMIINKL